MPKGHPKMYKKVANMVPKWAQVGAMLCSKIVLNASKSGKGTENRTGMKFKTIPSGNHGA